MSRYPSSKVRSCGCEEITHVQGKRNPSKMVGVARGHQRADTLKICIEANENENMKSQNLWDSVKAVLRGRFIAIQAYLKKQEKHQINNLTLYLKHLEKEEKKNPKVSRRKDIIKIRAEINEK